MGKKEQIIERLNNEIKWCKENKSTAPKYDRKFNNFTRNRSW